GLDDLVRARLLKAGSGNVSEASPVPTLINVRHEGLLREAVASLDAARTGAGKGAAEECVALDLKNALDRLNSLTGEGTTDELLDSIFSRFCIGK
ncbi:MAG: tRNA uridine-5-carboxymethylaminomethyl(34) synthesis GTPase MnmE, partial [Elusimicrobia bacterium]|nr:tRNA uridine-5-carboxymethylaminomethyl(34) synthesis GTPase MnmE [Elusimicrobiota bacterium]